MKNETITKLSLMLSTPAYASGTVNPFGGWVLGVVAILALSFTIGFHLYLFKKLSACLIPRVQAVHIIREITVYSVIIFWSLFFIRGFVQNNTTISYALIWLQVVSFIMPFIIFVVFKLKYEKEFNKSLNQIGAKDAPPG